VQVTSFINNVILGHIHVEHDGVMRVTQQGGDLAAAVTFKEPGVFERHISGSSGGGRHPVHGVKGHVEGKQGKVTGAKILVGGRGVIQVPWWEPVKHRLLFGLRGLGRRRQSSLSHIWVLSEQDRVF
jgi:hypothetical protein